VTEEAYNIFMRTRVGEWESRTGISWCDACDSAPFVWYVFKDEKFHSDLNCNCHNLVGPAPPFLEIPITMRYSEFLMLLAHHR